MGKLVTCKWCEATSDLDFTEKCYGCDRDLTVQDSSKRQKKGSEATSISEAVFLADPKLIKAVNRTTYAIRSIALFLFISLCSSVCGYALITASTGNPVRCAVNGSDCGEPGLAIFGGVVLAAGFFVALVVGISELGKSKL